MGECSEYYSNDIEHKFKTATLGAKREFVVDDPLTRFMSLLYYFAKQLIMLSNNIDDKVV